MRISPWIVAASCCLFALPAPAADKNEVPKDVQAVLDKAAELEVYSLDPVTPENPKGGFHGWKVLGKTSVKDAEERKKFLTALSKGVAENPDKQAKCFQPRHGLRAKLDGKTVDLAICFECLHIKVYVNDTERDQPILVSGSPEALFDKVLKDAKVKLADKPAK